MIISLRGKLPFTSTVAPFVSVNGIPSGLSGCSRWPRLLRNEFIQGWAASAGRSADQAPAIIFVPGFSSSSLTFRKQFQDEKLLMKYCLVTYEPRGQCRSQQPLSESAYSSKKNAQDFKAVCDKYGVKTAILAGWSYGGLIATDVFSHLGPGWIRGIVYLSGVPWRSMLPEVLHSDGANALQPLIEGDAEEVAKSVSSVLDTCFHSSSISSMSYSEHSALAGVIAQQNPTARRLLMNARYQDHTKLLQAAKHLPTMLVIGEYDRQIYWEKLDSFLKGHFPLYRLSLIEGVGHSAFWEKPEEVNPLMETFVDECR